MEREKEPIFNSIEILRMEEWPSGWFGQTVFKDGQLWRSNTSLSSAQNTDRTFPPIDLSGYQGNRSNFVDGKFID